MMIVLGYRTLQGYHFMDNLLEQRFGPQNGHAVFNTGIPIPDQISFCFKFRVSYDRYSRQISLFEIFRENETQPSASLLCKFIGSKDRDI